MHLQQSLVEQIDNFIAENDLIHSYRNYHWGNDNWDSGFPDILHLELLLKAVAESKSLPKNHLIAVSKWGRLRNIARVSSPDMINISAKNLSLAENESDYIIALLLYLRKNTKGLGPTYLSKILRFMFPSAAGAIDTRIVGAFGLPGRKWLKLKVIQSKNNPHIPWNQSGWPEEYGKWLKILSYIANKLNNDQLFCPHPSKFVEKKLRNQGIWTPADVEMALFSSTYSSS